MHRLHGCYTTTSAVATASYGKSEHESVLKSCEKQYRMAGSTNFFLCNKPSNAQARSKTCKRGSAGFLPQTTSKPEQCVKTCCVMSSDDDLSMPVVADGHSEALKTLNLIKDGEFGEHPPEAALREVANLDICSLTAAAAFLRDQRMDASVITFSPKVFIPLTRACRDACGYCTFVQEPKPGQSVFMRVHEVLEIAKAGAAAGCTEALFTLGDKPELRYALAKEELASLGHSTTVSYLTEVAKAVIETTGLLPHINAGVMSRSEIALLRHISVSQGLMLESTSKKLLEPGGPHYNCPDKRPSSRLASIVAAGKEMVPFTTGLLIGIGESREDRLADLLLLRGLHQQLGHIQELIIQNFRAKKGTVMETAEEPSVEELKWTIAMARLTFGPSMSIQVPPNLTPDRAGEGAQWKTLISAGINDWGGISPLTKDWVNPEAPWPHLAELGAATSKAGKLLVPRLAVYPFYIQNASMWLDSFVIKWLQAHSNSLGYARADNWSPGLNIEVPWDSKVESQAGCLNVGKFSLDLNTGYEGEVVQNVSQINLTSRGDECITVGMDGSIVLPGQFYRGVAMTTRIQEILKKTAAEEELSEEEITNLFYSIGPDFKEVCDAANKLRRCVNGEKVTYVVNRNINYTNICTYKCQFCAFSKGKYNEDLRGKPYRAVEAWNRGATEVCMQGGIHPEYTGQTYLDILKAVKSAVPDMHVHAFSPLEVFQGAATLHVSIQEFLLELKVAGLGSLPGTAAEILDDDVRKKLCPDKIMADQWLEVMDAAHSIGLPTTSTIMFGHIDHPKQWARHLLHIRRLQKKTSGFTEFVPLPFVHMQAPVYLKGEARKGPTKRECVLMHAVARLVLHPLITNIQASWVKMGPSGAQALLLAGCNDMGGSLMNESITRAAGASFGQELPPEAMEKLICSFGRLPQQRTTLYADAPLEQIAKSFTAARI
ncbi:hypothetical protein O6H91_02G027500 [Diphasiastrum complanatum]|uniref:Uncharacterized protein n=1 Tax=Diphasiastrum complanatum TaxID=34168 RepID=A0ACC2EDQ0_DIPCM|nr:hypothetical protein O6H91_02G027500 [Diphasiastrum complanatum]